MATQPLTTLSIRATEYTVGANGPQAMPAELPPTSAYTYAVELSADEAMAAGATEVRFSSPLPFDVDNFLGFPIGTTVPLGGYGVWVPADSGKVIKIVNVTGGLADLDIDGDGISDGGAALAALSITDWGDGGERQSPRDPAFPRGSTAQGAHRVVRQSCGGAGAGLHVAASANPIERGSCFHVKSA